MKKICVLSLVFVFGFASQAFALQVSDCDEVVKEDKSVMVENPLEFGAHESERGVPTIEALVQDSESEIIPTSLTPGDTVQSLQDSGAVVGQDEQEVQQETTPVPEPSTLLLFGAGLLGMVSVRNRRKRL